MITFFKNLFASTDYKQLIADGALVIDVRSKAEYKTGAIKKSINIPLDRVEKELKKIVDLNQTLIFCCRSGNRSAQATRIVTSQGAKAYNGGAWNSLQRKIKN